MGWAGLSYSNDGDNGDIEQLLFNGIDSEHNYACISRSLLSSRVERYRVFHSESQLFAKKYVSTELVKPHNFEK